MSDRMGNFGFFLSRTFASTKARGREWPFVPGTYTVVDPAAPVAVCTLGSVSLAPAVAREAPAGLCIAGKVETENIGIEKIIKNVISNPAIRFLVCAGKEPPKHLTGATILALFANGIDDRHRIPGSPGMRPVLPNTTSEEVEIFRNQVVPIDLIGLESVTDIHNEISKLSDYRPNTDVVIEESPTANSLDHRVEHVRATGTDPLKIKLDKAGYFVINIDDHRLLIEHYSYKEKLLRTIEGEDARSIYLTLIRNGWVSRLDHAAYLGRQLTRAELSIRYGFDFRQDGA